MSVCPSMILGQNLAFESLKILEEFTNCSSGGGNHHLRGGVRDNAEGEVEDDQAQDSPVPLPRRRVRHHDDRRLDP